MSPEHFYRIFKKITGLSPNQYVIRSRIEFAKSLLLNSSNDHLRNRHLVRVQGRIFFQPAEFCEKNGLPPVPSSELPL